jgi:hypothetical protein
VRALQAIVLATAAVLGGTGCGGGDGGGSCPDELPPSCPTPAPTFSMDADPIIQSYCVPCHSPGGVEPTRLLDTYDHVRALISTVIMQVRGCSMPPAGYPQLTNDQRRTLLGWASSCDALDN